MVFLNRLTVLIFHLFRGLAVDGRCDGRIVENIVQKTGEGGLKIVQGELSQRSGNRLRLALLRWKSLFGSLATVKLGHGVLVPFKERSDDWFIITKSGIIMIKTVFVKRPLCLEHFRNISNDMPTTPTPPTDYSNSKNWLNAFPTKDFPSDVFYLYPTAWPGDPKGALTCAVEHPAMRHGAATVFGVQASVFFPLSRVYAPYYRQLNNALNLCEAEREAAVHGAPYDDAKAAFEWYFRNWNGGHPFFLFAHSQGSHVAKQLVFNVIARHPAMLERMVAAYMIGFGVTQTELDACPHVPFAERADDTGVIVSYNTEPPGYEAINPTVPPGSVAINPLTWTRNDTPASASINPGSLITAADGWKFATVLPMPP